MGLSTGAIVGIAIGSVALCALVVVVAMWHSSAERKRKEAQAKGGGSSATSSATLQPAPSAKGDRFLSNLVPSFVKRGEP